MLLGRKLQTNQTKRCDLQPSFDVGKLKLHVQTSCAPSGKYPEHWDLGQITPSVLSRHGSISRVTPLSDVKLLWQSTKMSFVYHGIYTMYTYICVFICIYVFVFVVFRHSNSILDDMTYEIRRKKLTLSPTQWILVVIWCTRWGGESLHFHPLNGSLTSNTI